MLHNTCFVFLYFYLFLLWYNKNKLKSQHQSALLLTVGCKKYSGMLSISNRIEHRNSRHLFTLGYIPTDSTYYEFNLFTRKRTFKECGVSDLLYIVVKIHWYCARHTVTILYHSSIHEKLHSDGHWIPSIALLYIHCVYLFSLLFIPSLFPDKTTKLQKISNGNHYWRNRTRFLFLSDWAV